MEKIPKPVFQPPAEVQGGTKSLSGQRVSRTRQLLHLDSSKSFFKTDSQRREFDIAKQA